MKKNLTIRQVGWLAICGLSVLVVNAGAYGVPLSLGGAMFVGTTQSYQGPVGATPGEWNTVAPLGGSATIKGEDGFVEFVIGASGSNFSWTGNELDQDLSDDLSVPAGPSRAEATFKDGGTMTLTGSIFPTGVPPLPWNALYTGTLLEATVSGFRIQETLIDSNKINSVDTFIEFEVTGGWLFTNSITQMRGLYEFALVGADTEPMSGGSLANFQEDLVTLSSYQMNINAVPEPTSMILLAFGGWLMSRRKSRV